MLKRNIYLFVAFIFASLTACDSFQSPNTVVLDLDAIANATGQAAIIKQQVEAANKDLNSQLKTISVKLNDQLVAEKKKIGKKATKNDQLNLEQLTLQANQKMQQAKAVASQKSQQYKALLIQKLRLEVAPIAENIARERGADIVITSNNSMLWFNSEIDITDEVIGVMRANPTPANTEAADSANSAEEAAKPAAQQTSEPVE